MQPLLDGILTVNLVASTIVFYVAARLYVLPHLDRWTFRDVMPPILLLHSLRHLGLMFLTRGATYPGLPPAFARPAALGDLLSARVDGLVGDRPNVARYLARLAARPAFQRALAA